MPRDVPMSDAQWDTMMGKAEFKEHKGRPAIVFAQEGAVAPKGLTLRNGTIELAPFSELPDGKEPTIADLPGASAGWRGLTAERGGLINVTRVYGLPSKRPVRSVTWLKTTISSKTSQSKKVAIGWTREIWVFVNGQRVFADKNLYQPPSARKSPDGRLSLENGSFVLPLNAGDNEVAIALANNFYGWGLMLRLDDLEGIQLARK